MLDGAMECARRAGLIAGVDFALAVDAAASHFYANGRYTIDGDSFGCQPVDRSV